MQLENIKGIRFGMFIIEKNLVLILLGTRYFRGGGGGVATFWGSLFLGFYEKSETFDVTFEGSLLWELYGT